MTPFHRRHQIHTALVLKRRYVSVWNKEYSSWIEIKYQTRRLDHIYRQAVQSHAMPIILDYVLSFNCAVSLDNFSLLQSPLPFLVHWQPLLTLKGCFYTNLWLRIDRERDQNHSSRKWNKMKQLYYHEIKRTGMEINKTLVWRDKRTWIEF